MKETIDYEKDLASIRSLMERSSRFISLSGLSGVLAGIFALVGAVVAYYLIYYPHSPFGFRFYYVNQNQVFWQLLLTAACVVVASLVAGIWLTNRKAKRQKVKMWENSSRRLVINAGLPMVVGGLFIFVLITRGYYVIIAPASLLFYGLALVSGAQYTLSDVKYLGYCEIILGLISGFIPGYGLLFWAFGFGVLHILYGIIMYHKYDK